MGAPGEASSSDSADMQLPQIAAVAAAAPERAYKAGVEHVFGIYTVSGDGDFL